MADDVILTRGVVKRYGSYVAVRDVDLAVEGGTIFGFVGPSGSGKTTTVRLLTGSERPSAGEVWVLGGEPSAFTPDQRARMGYMPQLSVLYPELSLRQNLSFVASIYGLPLRGRRRRMRRVLDLVELSPHRGKRLGDTSGGMQRRLALAAALMHDPELLFLDEPTAGIDPVLRRRFWAHFAELRSQGRTMFVTTQYVGEAESCDRVGVIAHGRLLVVDTPDGLRRRAYGGQILDLVAETRVDERLLDELAALPYVVRAELTGTDGRGARVVVEQAGTAAPRLQQFFSDRDVELEELREHVPRMDDVFVTLVQATS